MDRQFCPTNLCKEFKLWTYFTLRSHLFLKPRQSCYVIFFPLIVSKEVPNQDYNLNCKMYTSFYNGLYNIVSANIP